VPQIYRGDLSRLWPPSCGVGPGRRAGCLFLSSLGFRESTGGKPPVEGHQSPGDRHPPPATVGGLLSRARAGSRLFRPERPGWGGLGLLDVWSHQAWPPGARLTSSFSRFLPPDAVRLTGYSPIPKPWGDWRSGGEAAFQLMRENPSLASRRHKHSFGAGLRAAPQSRRQKKPFGFRAPRLRPFLRSRGHGPQNQKAGSGG